MKRKLLRCMTMLATMLFASSCTSELALEGVPQSGVAGEEVEVTFSVSAQSANSSMRDADATDYDGGINGTGPGKWQKYIGRGKKIDMLIYAVYDENYDLLEQYGNGTFPSSLSGKTAAEMKYQNDEGEDVLYAHTGQTILDVSQEFGESGNGEVKITLRLMRGKTYRIAFWAQSSTTEAFNTDDLKEVKVIYEGAKNNDELRDAFCKVEKFSVTTSGEVDSRTVTLTRPFAQINVGTTGADYKHVATRAQNSVTYTMSKMILKGVANTINVVEDKIIKETDDDKSAVTFDFAKIPAMVKGNNNLIGNESTITADESGYISTKDLNEEFLRIDLDGDKQIKEYKLSYPTIEAETEDEKTVITSFLTETFKYLSMCYVLVPAEKTEVPKYDEDDEDPTQATEETESTEEDDIYGSGVLDGVSIFLAEQDAEGQPTNDRPRIEEMKYVPVHRNWRTNILFGLHNSTNDDDPNDPTSIYAAESFKIILDPNFDGEYNGVDDGHYKDTDDDENTGNELEDWDEDKYSDNQPPSSGE